jgi:hemolysin III
MTRVFFIGVVSPVPARPNRKNRAAKQWRSAILLHRLCWQNYPACFLISLSLAKKTMSHHSHGGKIEPKFSASIFLITIAVTLAVLFGALALIAPGVWHAQLSASWASLIVVFLVVHCIDAFVEFGFHRYVLHAPLIPFLSYFYKQHTLHHALTRVGYQKAKKGKPAMPCLVENRYPIVDEKQHEASYFPWYTLAAFALLASCFFAPVQWLLPHTPVFLGGFLAIAWSLMLYELIHAVEHWPQATWDRLVAHPTQGRFWRKAYAFHLRHHADIRCNEAISGVFGLPLPDLLFGTYVDPESLYRQGQQLDAKEFVSPQPRFGLIRWLDRQAEKAIKRRRQRRASTEVEAAAAPVEEALPPVFTAVTEARTRL